MQGSRDDAGLDTVRAVVLGQVSGHGIGFPSPGLSVGKDGAVVTSEDLTIRMVSSETG